MLKSAAALLIVLSPLVHAETDCTGLKIQAADQLQAACASSAELTQDEVAGFQEVSRGLASECADTHAAETLERGVLYKKLELKENCAAKADALATR